ncbi:amidohydrolase family protein [Paraneptunicella aestuarii]|uniref:metal-dependent hydrolase family protein n=1 Tax=Paraneptunicella aestuarii TaxID=2831148 RepID=UPI001E4F145A|nr:amidohydrolase family protein [Paraneptunicella aestuarii]UAA39260.1 amidohydrolase family protein [Paraneptunicella aestuarii]
MIKFATLCTLLLTSTLTYSKTLIHAGKLIPANNSEVLYRATVVVEDNKIVGIESGFTQPESTDQVIDLKNATVMPGLMDMHVHITSEHNPNNYVQQFTMNPTDNVLKGVVYANRTLMAGFTTVRNLGDRGNETIALRNAINRGDIVGPRIYTAAKSIATTGGHADPTNGRKFDLMGDPGPRDGVISGTDEARKAVRQRYKDGADLIKITATGGVLSLAKSGQNPQFMTDELEAIVATARDYGMTVAVHAHGKEGMERAIRAGVDSIEHGTYIGDDTIELMKQHGTYYVPTVTAGNWVAKKSEIDGFFPDIVRPKAASIGPLIQRTFARAYNAGVKIAFGTDSGVSPHGENGEEFVLMVQAGMDPLDAIRSATYHGAQLLKIDDQLGTIEAGKLADIVAVNGDPLRDIKSMMDVVFVMKDGKVFKQ